MNLYHGGIEAIENPMFLPTSRRLDFGNGFYTTTNIEQAERWAVVKMKRTENAANAIVSVYRFDENLLESNKFKIKIFESADKKWLEFVLNNRSGNQNHDFDIIKGPVANDNLFSTLTLLESGILTIEETIVRLKPHRLFDQISFHNQAVISELQFIEFKKHQ